MTAALASLVARRLCHDFAGPVGAIAAALDMLADVVRKEDVELVSLVADSADGLSATLRLYRYALNPSDVAGSGGIAHGFVADWLKTRVGVDLEWAGEGDWRAGVAELTAGLAMCAAEAATRGGTLHVDAGVVRLVATTVGLPDGAAAVLAGGAMPSTTKLAVHGCLAAQAALLGGSIAVETAADGVTLRYQGSVLP